MTYHPPISKRTDEQLMAIIENPEDWKTEAVESAKAELLKRGISRARLKHRAASKKRYRSRIAKIKSSSSYSYLEMTLLVIIGWPITVFTGDFQIFYSGKGFKKKNRQGILVALIGILFWLSIAQLFHQF